MKTKCKTCNKVLQNEEIILCKCGSPICISCMLKDGCCKECKEVQETGELPKVMRRSYIDMYEKCPYRFYLDVIKGIPSPPSPHAEVGIELHNLFEKYSLNEKLTLKEMQKEYTSIEENMDSEMFENEKQRKKLKERAEISMINFFEMNKNKPHPYMTEKRLSKHIGEGLPKVSIAMDRINKIKCKGGEEYEVVDYKTGKPLIGKQLKASLQVPLYISIIQSALSIRVERFELQYLAFGSKRVFERMNDDIYICKVKNKEYEVRLSDTIKRVQKIFEKMKNKQYKINSKQPIFNCKFCPYLKDGNCEGKEERLWKQ